jgi:UPF0716 protein FxsA
MCRFILLLILLIPVVEIYCLLEVGEQIGGWETLSLVIVTAAIGLRYVQFQGASMPMRLQRGEIEPTQAAIEGTVLSVGALALLIPGFITDALGVVCLLPWTRRIIANNLLTRMARKMKENLDAVQSGLHSGMHPGMDPFRGTATGPYADDDVIVVKRRESPPDTKTEATQTDPPKLSSD